MTQIIRPDLDIEESIRDIVAHYPPLQADRYHVHITVQDGAVTLSGHVRSLVTRRYLVDHVARVSGVYAVDSDSLYTEETIRLEAGQCIPTGVIANADYGTVILTGQPAENMDAEAIARDLARIPGVERVIAKF